MFRLYETDKGISMIDMSEDESDIIDTLGKRVGLTESATYLVIDDSQGYDDTRALVSSVDDYLKYKYRVDVDYKPKIKIKKR